MTTAATKTYSPAGGSSLVAGTDYLTPTQVSARVKRIRCASIWGGLINVAGAEFSNGTTELSVTDKVPIVLNGLYSTLQFMMHNQSATQFSGNPVGNAITFNLSVEVNNRLIHATFAAPHVAAISSGGRAGYLIGDGQTLLSDPVRIGGPVTGGTVNIRKYHVVGAGEHWAPTCSGSYYPFTSMIGGLTAKTTSNVYGATVTDQSDQNIVFGTAAYGNFTDTGGRAWMPILVVGEQSVPTVTVGQFGDSIIFGGGNNTGYISQACADGSIFTHMDATDGWKLADLGTTDARAMMAPFFDYVICHAATNDLSTGGITTLGGLQTATQNFVRAYSHESNRIAFCTITPQTTGSWATYGGQTPYAGVANYQSLRIQYNNWLRDLTSSGAVASLNTMMGRTAVIATIDANTLLERNSDGTALVLDANGQQTALTGMYWLVNCTADGSHMTTLGKTTAKACINAATKFVLPLAA